MIWAMGLKKVRLFIAREPMLTGSAPEKILDQPATEGKAEEANEECAHHARLWFVHGHKEKPRQCRAWRGFAETD